MNLDIRLGERVIFFTTCSVAFSREDLVARLGGGGDDPPWPAVLGGERGLVVASEGGAHAVLLPGGRVVWTWLTWLERDAT